MQKNGWQPTRSRTKSTEGQELTLAEIRALTGPALARPSETLVQTGLVVARGYLSQVFFEQCFAQGLQLMAADRPLPIALTRKNMQNRLVVLEDKLLTRKRFVIGTIVDQHKNISRIEHSRHRSTTNFIVNLIAGLIAYTWQAKKPSLNLSLKMKWLSCRP